MTHRWVVPLSLGILLGASCGIFSAGYHLPLLALGGGMLSAFLYSLGFQKAHTLLICIGCFGIALGTLRFESELFKPQPLLTLVGETITQTGIVVSEPDIREASMQFVTSIQSNGEEQGRVVVRTPLQTPIFFGETITLTGLIERPEPFATDAGRMFAYDKWLLKDGICCVMPFPTIEHGKDSGRFPVRSVLVNAKGSFIEAMGQSLPEPEVSLGAGLLLGARHSLGVRLTDTFRTVGLSHIVVLSGFNMTVIADIIAKAGRFLPGITASVVSAGSILVFAVLVGGGATVVRAAIMALIAVVARATGRTYGAPRALCIAAALMALHSPLIVLYDPGFQLSFIATLSLLVLADPIQEKLLWIRFSYLRSILSTTLAAQIGVLPLLLYQTGSFSLVSILANILVLPIVPLAMALSFVAGIIGFVGGTIALVAGVPAYLTLAWILQVATVFANVPFAQIILPAFPLSVTIAIYVIAWMVWQKSHRL